MIFFSLSLKDDDLGLIYSYLRSPSIWDCPERTGLVNLKVFITEAYLQGFYTAFIKICHHIPHHIHKLSCMSMAYPCPCTITGILGFIDLKASVILLAHSHNNSNNIFYKKMWSVKIFLVIIQSSALKRYCFIDFFVNNFCLRNNAFYFAYV